MCKMNNGEVVEVYIDTVLGLQYRTTPAGISTS